MFFRFFRTKHFNQYNSDLKKKKEKKRKKKIKRKTI